MKFNFSDITYKYIHDTLTQAEKKWLNSQLKKDDDFKEQFLQELEFDSLLSSATKASRQERLNEDPSSSSNLLLKNLEKESRSSLINPAENRGTQKFTRRKNSERRKVATYKNLRNKSLFNQSSFWISTAALVFIAIFITLFDQSYNIFRRHKEYDHSLNRNALHLKSAQLISSDNVEWVGSQPKEEFLDKGHHLLFRRGILHFRFNSGVEATLQGPASLILDGENEANLYQGRFSAYVPEQAVGFSIKSPLVNVVDLGTSFILDAPLHEASELSVTKGSIEALTSKSQKQVLKENMSVCIFQDGSIHKMKYLSDMELIHQSNELSHNEWKQLPHMTEKHQPYVHDENILGGVIKTRQNEYHKGISMLLNSQSSYKLDGDYTTLKGKLYFHSPKNNQANTSIHVKIFADKKLILNHTMTSKDNSFDLNLEINSPKTLKLDVNVDEAEQRWSILDFANARLIQ
ncbi:MAG: NPCBM/NEW2 domain-containing protein [Planctomycetes bacterium]|nr:NPCBM/NEW2 domain-containing protein [Planctomycetota bacterium]